MAKVTKKQLNAAANLLAKFAQHNGNSVDELTETLQPLNSVEAMMYNAQAILNFFQYRVKPCLEKNEAPAKFDARYREWRIRLCKECEERFAYAWDYDGVSYCSMECIDKALIRETGIRAQRGRDLKLRWGVTAHPAIVDAESFAALADRYEDQAADAFALD